MDDITAKVSTKGQMTVPKAVRDALGITGGTQLVFRVDDGRAMVARTKRLLDTAAAPPDQLPATSRLPWDANRRSRLHTRAKPQRPAYKERASQLDPVTEFTVDLRTVPEPEGTTTSPDLGGGDLTS